MRVILMRIYIFIWMCGQVSCDPCPQQASSLVHANQLTIATSYYENITMSQQADTTCYEYTYPAVFTERPSITIAMNQFHSAPGTRLYLSIWAQQLRSPLISVIFVIRTQWVYTNWHKIMFGFLAEALPGVQSGSTLIHTGCLGACSWIAHDNNQMSVQLPLHLTGRLQQRLFLHGFQIDSQEVVQNQTTSRSPFEVRPTSSIHNSTLIISLSLQSPTQIHHIHISYIVYQAELWIMSNSIMYTSDNYQPVHIPAYTIQSEKAFLHGFSSIVMHNQFQVIQWSAAWDGHKFDFHVGDQLVEMVYEYVFMMGEVCHQCEGFPYVYEDLCVVGCPLPTHHSPLGMCIHCAEDEMWDGYRCNVICQGNKVYNQVQDICQCPPTSHWNNQQCIYCHGGKVWQPQQLLCDCDTNMTWNGYQCIPIENCTNGQQWNVYIFKCQCPYHTVWNSTHCIAIPFCTGNMILNSARTHCICPQGMYKHENICIKINCTEQQYWNGKECVCKRGNWDGESCVLCMNGTYWEEDEKTCICPVGTSWKQDKCVKICSHGRVWDRLTQRCICPVQHIWNGFTCMSKPTCPATKQWDYSSGRCICPSHSHEHNNMCIQCSKGKKWNQNTHRCECQEGMEQIGQQCYMQQMCINGQVWNSNTYICECMSDTVWNGYSCGRVLCEGESQKWQHGHCTCVQGYERKNGRCVEQRAYCQNGTIWNEQKHKCQCPYDLIEVKGFCVSKPQCLNGEIYSPYEGKCLCRGGYSWIGDRCMRSCRTRQMWDGSKCVKEECWPGTSWNGQACTHNYQNPCEFWEFWDGQKCIYYPYSCPEGMRWNTSQCITILDQCPPYTYWNGHACEYLPQQCYPPTKWNGRGCMSVGYRCPYGTYYHRGKCMGYDQCEGQRVWNQEYIRCVCPGGSGWNGNTCVQCNGGRLWVMGLGCMCQDGSFWTGAECQQVQEQKCKHMLGTQWSHGRCMCMPGYEPVGMQCICRGTVHDQTCDRCAHKPNSAWKHNRCSCKPTYVDYLNICISRKELKGDGGQNCGVGTYVQGDVCVPCSGGCLSCLSGATCIQCDVHFTYNHRTYQCDEHCGDGYRFYVQCDDGNNQDGDGCSRDCKVETGWTCVGGSPNHPDMCSNLPPLALSYELVGQIRMTQEIIVNIRMNTVPAQFLQSGDCYDRCGHIFDITIIGLPNVQVEYHYVPQTNYNFQLRIHTSQTSPFILHLVLKPTLSSYFPSTDITTACHISIDPSYLQLVSR